MEMTEIKSKFKLKEGAQHFLFFFPLELKLTQLRVIILADIYLFCSLNLPYFCGRGVT